MNGEVRRWKTPAGWLVESVHNGASEQSVALCFVPDVKHEWELDQMEVKQEPENIPAPAASNLPPVKLTRAEIKLKLENLGIPFNDRLRTENLELLLSGAEKGGNVLPAATEAKEPLSEAQKLEEKQHAPNDPTHAPDASNIVFNREKAETDFFGEPVTGGAGEPAAKLYTIAEAVEIAKRLAAKFGPDKTVAIIQSYGVANITMINEKGKLQDFVAKVLKREKEYEKK